MRSPTPASPRHSASEMILGPPYHRHGKGPAGWSIKAYGGGGVPFQVDRRDFWIDDQSYLFVNAGQDYEFWTPARSTLFNFTIFLSDADLREAWASHVQPEESLLANGPASTTERPEFAAIALRVSEPINRLRSSLRRLWEAGTLTCEMANAGAARMIGEAITAQAEVMGQTRKVGAVRRATREETVSRIRRAVDYIEGNIRAPLDLDRLAGVACMAKHHFLRRFKDVMGVTPYQFVLRRRIEDAARLLLKSDGGAAAVGRACGFEDPGTFSMAFRAVKGLPPTAWRKAQLGNFSQAGDEDNG